MRDLALATVVIFFFIACTDQMPQEKILFDFETDADLDQIRWKCFTLFSLSDNHVTHGNSCLKMELYPSNWPGLAPRLDVNDWRAFDYLAFDDHPLSDVESLMDPNKPAPWDHLNNEEDDEDVDIDIREIKK